MRTLHAGLNDGIELAGHGEDERGFAAAVGAEDGDVLAGADGEVDVVQDDAVAARDVDVAQVGGTRSNCFASVIHVPIVAVALTC